jgi:hypothetical protein
MDIKTTSTLTINIELSGITPTQAEQIRANLYDVKSSIDRILTNDPYAYANIVIEGTKRETYSHSGAF